jgi:hypothetical protein
VTPRVEIVIDELVVRGLSNGDARIAAAALEARLGALATAEGVRPRAEAFRRLPAVEARSPRGVGDAVAGAVWSAVGGGGRR